ncbi:MAG TPA: proline--tRNA ligase [Acidimicrobiia bacterium]|nr:proline--tRNA ligase [Acidimicrobiia bacterium]
MAKQPVLTPRADDFPRWYQDVLQKAQLAENGPVRGTMVIRPYGYSIWERMQAEVDERIKACGAENAYFPLFIPQSYLEREAEHVEGFSPELAVVTIAGGKDLEEPVVVRPTSETVIGEFMAKWVQSYRDLPLLLNQWANVVRWELRPRLFLRTSEFLWQEGHTAHAGQADARAYAVRIHHEVYEDFMVNVLALPVVVGMKTARERFAGADNTMTLEAMMGDGKALQMATSHELGQNFARAFGIEFLDDSGTQRTAWTTSWGSSTRMVGGLIMAHGDDDGLRVPPRLAPIQAVVLVVRDEGDVVARCGALTDQLRAAGIRVQLDARADVSMGRRATDWELKGVPVRLEVGPRDLADGVATLVRRVVSKAGAGGAGGEERKQPVALVDVVTAVADELDRQQAALLAEATERRESHTVDVTTLDDAREAAGSGWARIAWDTVGPEGEAELAQASVSVRCLLRADGSLPESDDEPGLTAVVARSY